MKCQRELSIIGAYGGYSKTPAKHAPVVGNSVLNLLINILGSGSLPPWIWYRVLGGRFSARDTFTGHRALDPLRLSL
jgi:hypothetical protein